jgi:hypothetical protein
VVLKTKMQPYDLVCRIAAYPKFGADIFDPEQFFSFKGIDENKKLYVSSVVSRYLMRDDNGVHSYGEKYVNRANARAEIKALETGKPKITTSYLGFYILQYVDVKSLEVEYYDVSVMWRREHDCDAHFQIEFFERRNSATKAQKRNQRTIAASNLFAMARGPVFSLAVKTDAQIAELARLLPVQ